MTQIVKQIQESGGDEDTIFSYLCSVLEDVAWVQGQTATATCKCETWKATDRPSKTQAGLRPAAHVAQCPERAEPDTVSQKGGSGDSLNPGGLQREARENDRAKQVSKPLSVKLSFCLHRIRERRETGVRPDSQGFPPKHSRKYIFDNRPETVPDAQYYPARTSGWCQAQGRLTEIPALLFVHRYSRILFLKCFIFIHLLRVCLCRC